MSDPTIPEDIKTDENDLKTIAKAQLDGAATLIASALTSSEAELEKVVGQATMPQLAEGALESAIHAVPGGAVAEPFLAGLVAMAGGALSAVATHVQTSVDAKLKGFLVQGLAIIKSRQVALDADLTVSA